MGPKNVEMTAELANGWFPFLFIPERAQDVWGDALAAGSARRAPNLGPLEIAAGGLVAVGDGLEHLRELARPMTALYVGGMGARGQNFYTKLASDYGYPDEAIAIQDAYLAGRKDEAAALVPRSLLEGISLIGAKSHVAERLAALKQSGVTTLNVQPLAATHLERVRLIEQVKEMAA
jgi:alkanesulfonate monooxygenase SsuD/methylene tetrahydromethanopterin reductase-like flavin-dependent oxidoreductase (luciferase family)